MWHKMSETKWRVVTVPNDDQRESGTSGEHKKTYLEIYQTLYPNGLGQIHNEKYLELCSSKKRGKKNASGAKQTASQETKLAVSRPLDWSQYRLMPPTVESNAIVDAAKSQSIHGSPSAGDLSITLTPGLCFIHGFWVRVSAVNDRSL